MSIRWRVVLAAAAVLVGLSSCSDVIEVVDIAQVEIAPATTSVQVGATTDLTARLLGPQGETLSGRPVEWRSLDTGIAQVDDDGTVIGVAAGSTTIEASSNGVTGSAAVTVTSAPPTTAIGVNPTSLEFAGRRGAADPPPQAVQIINVGDGTLDGLTTSATYPGGQAGGWLSLALDGSTAPATLSVAVRTAGLDPGTYSATISIASAAAINSPQAAAVTFVVADAAPAIAAAPASVSLTSISDDAASPAPAQVAITNSGGGSLSGLNAGVSYAQDGATGWLNAQLAGATAPTTLTLTASRGALPVGTHRATVRVTAAGAEPLDIPVQYVIAVVAPAAPTSATATPDAHDRVRVEWTHDGANVDRFEIDRSNDGGATWATTLDATAAARSITDDDLNSSTTYTYGVRACNIIGCSPRTALVAARTAPAPPANLAASAAGPDRIQLTWSAVGADETGFIVERSTDAVNWTTAGQVGSDVTSFTDTGLSAATTYRYRVRACRAGVCSGPGTSAVATTAVPVPGAPADLAAAAVDTSTIGLSWSESSGTVSGYHIERSTSAGSGFVVVDTVAAGVTSFQNTGLSSGTTYYYRVRARNVSGFSGYSTVASATTLTPPPVPGPVPGAPGNLTATASGTATININWTASPGTVHGYHIERSSSPASGYAVVDTVAAGVTSFSDTDLTRSTTYFYRVRARNADGFSDYSNVTSATTQPPPANRPGAPGNLTASAIDATTIGLSWTASSGSVTGYYIERRSAAGSGFVPVDTVAAGVTSFQDTGLSSNTTYFYRVRARNANGFSDYSNEASATTLAPPPQLDASTLEQRASYGDRAGAGNVSGLPVRRSEPDWARAFEP